MWFSQIFIYKVLTDYNVGLTKSSITSQVSDWDRYAAEEYELLVAEEGGTDHQDDV